MGERPPAGRRVAARAARGISGLLVATLWIVAIPDAGAESWIAPLAPRSLLLDGARAGERLVVVGERGHVLLSDDDGDRWRQVVVPTVAMLTAVDFATDRVGWAVGHDAVILHTRDAGETWSLQHAAPELEAPLLDVLFLDAQRGFAVGAYGLFLATRDAGQTWTPRSISDEDAHYNAIFAAGGDRLVVAGEFGTLLESRDAGAVFRPLPSPYEASFFTGLALPGGDLVVLGLRGNAFHLARGTQRWQKLETGTESSLMAALALPGSRILIAGADGVLLEGTLAEPLRMRRRSDRETIARLLRTPSGRLLMLGTFGAEVRPLEPSA